MKNADTPVETVGLPNWIPEAGKWHRSTLALAEKLAAEDAQLVREIKQLRQFSQVSRRRPRPHRDAQVGEHLGK